LDIGDYRLNFRNHNNQVIFLDVLVGFDLGSKGVFDTLRYHVKASKAKA
jgi:hypothetical protein